MLNDEIFEFLASGVSIVVASRNAAFVPSIARAKGCRIVTGAKPRVRILISAAHAGELLDDVRGTGTISATFTLPRTHRALQLKGRDARVTGIDAQDREAMEEYVRVFAAVVDPLGFSAEFVRAYYESPRDEVAIEFEPSDAFQQTPGPAAGARLV